MINKIMKKYPTIFKNVEVRFGRF